MQNQHLLMKRLSARIQAFLLVAALALMLGLTGWLLGGATMAFSAIIAVVGLYWLQPLMDPHWLLRIQGGRPLPPEAVPDLYHLVGELAQRADLVRLPRIYLLPAKAMNAFTVGGGERSVVGVTGTLLQHLNRGELAAVLAHEIAHIRNQDTRVIGFAALLSQLIQGMSLLGQLLLIINLPLILTGRHLVGLAGILALILAPYAGLLIQLALSRSREYLADLEAAAMTGAPRLLAEALDKIERHNHGLRRFLMGWPGVKPTQTTLLRTHPPTQERVRRLMMIPSGSTQSAPVEAPAALKPARYPHQSRSSRWIRCRAYGLCA